MKRTYTLYRVSVIKTIKYDDNIVYTDQIEEWLMHDKTAVKVKDLSSLEESFSEMNKNKIYVLLSDYRKDECDIYINAQIVLLTYYTLFNNKLIPAMYECIFPEKFLINHAVKEFVSIKKSKTND